MKRCGNDLNDALILIEECVRGKTDIETFARKYLDLTKDRFSVADLLTLAFSYRNEVEEMFSTLRSDCAQFQPDPELYAELMKSAAYAGEFLNQDELRNRVESTFKRLKNAGVF